MIIGSWGSCGRERCSYISIDHADVLFFDCFRMKLRIGNIELGQQEYAVHASLRLIYRQHVHPVTCTRFGLCAAGSQL
jgi:hypothetical protein